MNLSLACPNRMRAARVARFGGIEAIAIRHTPVPKPANNEVLIGVKAAGVGPWDAWVRSGNSAVPQPLPLTLGSDLAGILVAAGNGTVGLSPGDAVFGVTNSRFTGAQAQYAVAEVGMIAKMPAVLGFVEAASIPVVATTGWSLVFEHGRVQPGQRILVHGGAGNVGAYAVQFAKAAGAYVIATCRGRDVNFVQSLGADEVVDTETTDFVRAIRCVDIVLDTVGGMAQCASLEIVAPGGAIVSCVSLPKTAKAGRHVRTVFFLVEVTTAKLDVIARMIVGGAVRTNIGEILPFDQIGTAHSMLAGLPHRSGKIVLTIDPH